MLGCGPIPRCTQGPSCHNVFPTWLLLKTSYGVLPFSQCARLPLARKGPIYFTEVPWVIKLLLQMSQVSAIINTLSRSDPHPYPGSWPVALSVDTSALCSASTLRRPDVPSSLWQVLGASLRPPGLFIGWEPLVSRGSPSGSSSRRAPVRWIHPSPTRGS